MKFGDIVAFSALMIPEVFLPYESNGGGCLPLALISIWQTHTIIVPVILCVMLVNQDLLCKDRTNKLSNSG